MTEWRLPLFDTKFGAEEKAAVLRPLEAGWLTMGDEVLNLEEELAAITGARHAIAVTNCTAALHLAIVALDLDPGAEVLCPTLSFVATANAPQASGAQIVLCGSRSEDDLTIDPDAIASKISNRTGAIIPMHYAGFACAMDEIMAIADHHGIPVIEDSAHAVFGQYGGKTLGLHGRAGCYSFYSNKNITSGEGGALVTDDDKLAAKLRLLRSHGMTVPTLDRHRRIATGYDVVMPGFNARMDEIRAALLRAQLRRLPEYAEQRRRLFTRYARLLADTPISVPFSSGRFEDELANTSVHIMSVLLPKEADRGKIREHLARAGIQTSVHYEPIHRFQMYRDHGADLDATAAIADRQLTLPFYPLMEDADADTVVGELLNALAFADATALQQPR